MIKRKLLWLLIGTAISVTLIVAYIRANPLIFNESLWEHAHCIKIAGLSLNTYAAQNGGKFPSHPKGYGNALLLLDEDTYHTLTGPGYSDGAFHKAKQTNTDLPEAECGRVYIQNLTNKSNPEIALLFDKQPTPGGDHCHLPFRMWAPLGREVLFVDCTTGFVQETAWPEFVRTQIKLLVNEGFRLADAEHLFEPPAKPKNGKNE